MTQFTKKSKFAYRIIAKPEALRVPYQALTEELEIKIKELENFFWFMGEIFNVVFYQPILSVLIFIYDKLTFHDLGLAIIILTILVRIIIFPLFYKSAKDQALMQRLQPHIKKIQSDHKNDKAKQAQELLALYRKHRFNPFSGIFILFLQLPIFIVLFKLFTKGLETPTFDSLVFLDLINLGQRSLIITFIAAFLQYLQGRLSIPKPAPVSQKSISSPLISSLGAMVYIGPIFTVIVLSGLPSALGLYWVISTLFSIGQQIYINRKAEFQAKKE